MPPEALPPAQPTYVLRGHTAQIHALHFMRGNTRLLTGDADGWVVCWDITYKRPVAVWRAHEKAILGIAGWEESQAVITHSRDNRLIVWQLGIADEPTLSQTLPMEDTASVRAQPWILHILTVNALNFCSFSMCPEVLGSDRRAQSIVLAVPNTDDSEGIDVFQLPTERRISTIGVERSVKTGMVMALSISQTPVTILIAAGYESGHTMLYSQSTSSKEWETLYSCRPHTQPILSLSSCINGNSSYCLTSSADATIAKHPFGDTSLLALGSLDAPLKTVKTKHAGQQGLEIRADGKIFATAGWDSRVRVYSCKTMKEIAVLKWHKEGCMAVAFARIAVLADSNNDRVVRQICSEDGEETTEDSSGRQVARVQQQPGADGGIQQRTDIAHHIRQDKALQIHWLAAGSKDGKVSLWDIY